MYDKNIPEIIDYIVQKFKLGRTITMSRVLDLAESEQDTIKYELEQEGIHSSFEEDLITAWIN